MTLKFDDCLRQIGVPHTNFKVEATADNNFMLLTVGHLTNGSLVPIKSLDWYDCHLAVDVIIDICQVVSKVPLNLLTPLLLLLFAASITYACGVVSASVRLLLLAQVIQMNFAIVDTSSQLVDIWQVLEALNEVIDEPGRLLSSILDVLLALVSLCLLFFVTACLYRWSILIWDVIWITDL